MSAPCPPTLIALAERLADAAGAVIRQYFRQPCEISTKPDDTPVTIADRNAEASMRSLIERTYPDHGIFGEEFGQSHPDAKWQWVLDPIDGTRAFIAGKPMFGTLIALVEDGKPILGIIDQPVLGERWIGATGHATTFNGAAIATRRGVRLTDALLNTTSPTLFDGADKTRFARLSDSAGQTQFGGDCYGYGLLASGFIDLVAESGLKPYDYCALVPVIEGAGGIITDWRGARPTLQSDGRVLAAGDAGLHREALTALNEENGT